MSRWLRVAGKEKIVFKDTNKADGYETVSRSVTISDGYPLYVWVDAYKSKEVFSYNIFNRKICYINRQDNGELDVYSLVSTNRDNFMQKGFEEATAPEDWMNEAQVNAWNSAVSESINKLKEYKKGI